jgi:hypothetical protein
MYHPSTSLKGHQCITSVHLQYGDYIAFIACGRYALPAVSTSSICAYRRTWPVVKALD